MKIVICTTPIRPVPTDYPPFGSLAVIQSLRMAGYDPLFYDIDGTRPTFDEVIAYFRQERPDVIGISAVVSTAYGFVKRLALALKQELPNSIVIVGGNLAASAEILHRICKVDFCVIGEGERVIANLLQRLESTRNLADFLSVRGVSYLDACGDFTFTGYEVAIPAAEFLDPDFTILEQFSRTENYIRDPLERGDFAQDPRTHQPKRAGMKRATVISTKGCVARCTFCHRWDRGFRQIPPGRVIQRIVHLKERHNVGFIQFGDENFGSDRKALDDLLRLIKPLDILWQVAGVRARSMDPDLLKRMHDAGCVALYYGFETGSSEMLQVMEKNLELSHNIRAAQGTFEAGLFTIYQLVLGMPGESPNTIDETIVMVKQATQMLPQPAYKHLSINYIQALPGTPVYEYARMHRLIGRRIEDEEEYLLTISDVNACDDTKFINFTESPYLVVRSWRPRIIYEATVHWHQMKSLRAASPKTLSDADFESYVKGGYFNLQALMFQPWIMRLLNPIRFIPIWAWTLATEFSRNPLRVFVQHVVELGAHVIRRRRVLKPPKSLRLVMKEIGPEPTTISEKNMAPLRLGR